MLCVLDPRKNALVALRHALLVFATSPGLLILIAGLTTWAFTLTSLVPLDICVDAAWKSWRYVLPVLLGLMMFHKWGTGWGSWIGSLAGGEDEKAGADAAVSA